MKQIEREEALLDSFDSRSIAYDPDWAFNFVSVGISPLDLDELVAKLELQNFEPISNWMDNNITTKRLVSEIEKAANRIAVRITNIKSYSIMALANDLEPTLLRDGLESTLVLM
jgi:hypothetical protein